MSNPTNTDEYHTILSFPKYEINPLGVVRNRRTGHVLRQRLNPDGYWMVALYRDGRKMRFIHTLLLETFVGRRQPGLECRHLDGDPQNSALHNLCWGTPLENAADKDRHGTQPHG